MIYSITGNIEHSGLERKENGVMCHLLATYLPTHTTVNYVHTNTDFKGIPETFQVHTFTTNSAFPTATYA